jgi:ABC-2 type transport system permease protein
MWLQALMCELLKLKRARIPWIVAAAYALAPLMLGLMMAVLMHPEFGRSMGLLTAKAQMTIGAATWSTYLTLTAALFAGGVIVLAVIEAFVFGREYAEGTARDMLTLPVDRATLISAKLAVSASWFVATAAIVYLVALVIGFAIGLPGFGSALLAESLRRVATLTLQVLLTGAAGAWLAIVGRGYLAPIGVSVLLLLMGNLFSHTGWGPWVPWSILFLTAGTVPGVSGVGAASMAILVIFFLAVTLASYLSMDRSDHTH